MKRSALRTATARARNEAGVSMVEMIIAILVLTIGLVSLAQLFIVASFNNSYALATSGGANDAQRLVESWKTEAKANGVVGSAVITSSSYDEGTGECDAFVDLFTADDPDYDPNSSVFKEYVWVYGYDGALVGSATPSDPPDVPSGTLRSASEDSRLVYIRLVPKSNDARYGQEIVVMAMISEE